MENSCSSSYKSNEDGLKNRNILFSMDYDSGYISHNPESNLDSYLENSDNLQKLVNLKPIYLSEDALQETPEAYKNSVNSGDISEETSCSTTFISGSTESVYSQEIHYSGFNSECKSDDSSDLSQEIPWMQPIVIDNINMEKNSKLVNKNNSPNLHDSKTKNLAFYNITNTLPPPSTVNKKLTLIFSKEDKENVYSVKRKYPSLTPDKSGRNDTFYESTTSLEVTADSLEESSIAEEDKSDVSMVTTENGSVVTENESAVTENESTGTENESAGTENESAVTENESEVCENNVNDSFVTGNESVIIENNIEESVVSEVKSDPEEKDKIVEIDHQTIECNSNRNNNNIHKECTSSIADIAVFNGVVTENNESVVSEVKSDSEEKDKIVEIDLQTIECNSNRNNNNIIHKDCTSSIADIAVFNGVVTENNESIVSEVKSESEEKDKIVEIDHQTIECNSNRNNNDIIHNDCTSSNDDIPVFNGFSPNEQQNVSLQHNINSKSIEFSTKTIEFNTKNTNNDKEKVPEYIKSSTPIKPYQNPHSSNLSPDLFTEDTIEEEVVKNEIQQSSTSTAKERNIVKKDYMILRRAQNNLKGVIPPRSKTIVVMTINEMLNKIDSNKRYFWGESNCTIVNERKREEDSTSLLITSCLESCKKRGFPEILKDRCLGLCHNRSKFSEEFEDLCIKYGERYVSEETQSSCTVFDTNTGSPSKRRIMKSQWNTKSPGKRLSHLARRKISFNSNANLQPGSSYLAGSRARQILVDAKKLDLINRRRSPRKTPRKTPGKGSRLKARTPSSSAKKKLAMRFRKVTGEIENSTSMDESSLSAKRNLFQSPDENKKLGRMIASTSGTASLNSDKKVSASKRALFLSPSKSSHLQNMGFKRSPIKRLDFGLEKKRKRLDSFSDEFPSKLARCHSEIIPFGSQADIKTMGIRTRSEILSSQNRQTKELSTNDKKKLQLAIYEALRTQNILPTNPQFKTHASNLGRLTRKLFLLTKADAVGVTEKMLRIARHHVIAVVKGKSPEEIYEECLKQKTKNLKPQGYIAPGESVDDKNGKIPNSESKIERIRKAINFGDDNR